MHRLLTVIKHWNAGAGFKHAQQFLVCTCNLDVVSVQVAINWCVYQDAIPLPGARNMQQAEGNLGSLGWRLTTGVQEGIEAAADKVP